MLAPVLAYQAQAFQKQRICPYGLPPYVFGLVGCRPSRLRLFSPPVRDLWPTVFRFALPFAVYHAPIVPLLPLTMCYLRAPLVKAFLQEGYLHYGLKKKKPRRRAGLVAFLYWFETLGLLANFLRMSFDLRPINATNLATKIQTCKGSEKNT